MNISRRNNRFFATLAVGLMIVAAACGGSESSSDGERDRNISGGVVAEQSAHPAPYQVGIYRISPESLPKPWTMWRNYWGFVCSGVILNSRWIATTASCVSTYGAPWDNDRFRIGVGQVDPWAPNTYENEPKYMFGIESSISGGTWDNYALLKTDRPIDFAQFDTVRPIDLPFGLDESWPEKGTAGQISGYGFTKTTGRTVVGLRTALVEVLSGLGDTSCGAWDAYVGETRMCLGKANNSRGGLACPYDWGGPVVVNVDNRPVLAGIISEVDRLGNCADGGATLAVRMRSMIGWIAGGNINDFQATPDDGSVTLSWSAPRATWFTYDEDENWDPGTKDYVVEMSEDGGTSWYTVDDGVNTNTEVTIGGLENGKGYAFRVAALNDITADRADYRHYSPVAKAVIGKQEQSVTVPDLPNFEPDTPPTAAPTLEGQAPQGAKDIVADPAQPAGPPSTATSTPNASNSSGATSAPTTAVATSGGAGTVSTASVALSTFNPIGASEVAKLAKAAVPTGARVAVTVDKSSKKVCAVKGSTLVALTAGKCKVKVAVATGKGKAKSKSATITVAK